MGRNPPTGTVTFLFTDIEGSTRLWQNHAEAMRIGLARHDALVRRAIENEGGFVFKTVGDAFCAAFSTANQAARAMVESQRALQAEPWPAPIQIKVRMALHSGSVEERDGDYFGRPVNRVARLLALGHGGQCLLSQSARALLVDEGDSFPTRRLGMQRLKDLDVPEEVFQLEWSGSVTAFPPLRSLDNLELPNNLPIQITSFVGREEEQQQVLKLLRQTHLLTLVGSGGCGKSRLAAHSAAEMVGTPKDGVWLVELAPIHDPSLVVQSIASVLSPTGPALENDAQSLVEVLRHKEMLLLIDNCEHLVAECARVIEAVLTSCPRVTILCTSREPLSVQGEVTYRVPSLGFPNIANADNIESLTQYGSVKLFIERAVLSDSEFTVTNENAAALAEICSRLDGIPLAIELAAARIGAFSLEEICERLSDCFRLLTGGKRTALPRQKTLRSLIDWSYDLLERPEQILFARLGCFSGGWTMQSAEAVCAGGLVDEVGVLDLVQALIHKSLVVPQPSRCGTRFKFLETIRQYAVERLTASGEGPDVRKRHARYFEEFVQDGRAKLEGKDGKVWSTKFDAEIDNIRQAIEWCLADRAEGTAACSIVAHFGMHYYHRGLISEGITALQRAIEHANGTARDPNRLMAISLRGWLAHTADRTDIAEESFTELLRLAEGFDLTQTAAAYNGLGLVASQHKNQWDLSITYFQEVIRIATELGRATTVPLMNLAFGYGIMGQYDKGEAAAAAALAQCSSDEQFQNEVSTRFVLAQIKAQRDQPEASEDLLRWIVTASEGHGFLIRLLDALILLAEVLITQGRFEEALTTLLRAESAGGFGELAERRLECDVIRLLALTSLGRRSESEKLLLQIIPRQKETRDPAINYRLADATAHSFALSERYQDAAALQGAARAQFATYGRFFHTEWEHRASKLADNLRRAMGADAYGAAYADGYANPSAYVPVRLKD